jgi:hypothetical protein
MSQSVEENHPQHHRSCAAWLVSRPIHAPLDKTSVPLPDSSLIDPQISRDLLVRLAGCARSTIRARKAGAWPVLRRAASDVSSARSASLSTKAANCRLP